MISLSDFTKYHQILRIHCHVIFNGGDIRGHMDRALLLELDPLLKFV